MNFVSLSVSSTSVKILKQCTICVHTASDASSDLKTRLDCKPIHQVRADPILGGDAKIDTDAKSTSWTVGTFLV
jgi:hypothetical protein